MRPLTRDQGSQRGEETTPLTLPGTWQWIIHIAWVALAVNSLWVFGVTLVQTWLFAHDLPERLRVGLAELGLTPDFYFWFNLPILTLCFFAYFVVATLIFLRRPNDRMAVFVAVFLMAFGAANAYPVAPEYLGIPEQGSLFSLIPTLIANYLSWPLLVAFFALYPDGRFVPGWMRYIAVYCFFLSLAWGLFPATFAQPKGGFAIFLLLSLMVVFGSSLYAQVHRYRHHSSLLQRQQTKWLVYGLAVTVLAIMVQQIILIFILPAQTLTPTENVILELIGSMALVASVMIPLSVGLAILRYRLYDIDLIIKRTLVYGVLVGGLAVAYFGMVALLQLLSQTLTGPQSDLAIIAITLAIAALFNPVRRRFQDWIDRRFYREKVDFRQAFTTFARDVRTIIDLQELLRVLVTRTTNLLHISHGAVFLVGGTEETKEKGETKEFRLAEGRNLPADVSTLSVDLGTLARLNVGHPIHQSKDKIFSLLVPLIAPAPQYPEGTLSPITNYQSPQEAPTLRAQSLIGILALGPRLSEQDYSREDQTLLTGLADQAGTAIYVAQLIQEKQAEASRREETERQLEAYRNSPMGRAEALAQQLINQPETGLNEIHTLTQTAGQDPDTADLLEHLSRVIGYLGANLLTGFADGYSFIFASQSAPELLPVGLRTLIEHLSLPEAASIQGASEALALYRLCQQALEANSIQQIAECGLVSGNYHLPLTTYPFLNGLTHGLSQLRPAAEALHAYERVDASPDKLAYLASAVERLSHVDRLARAELGSADRPIIQRLAANWLAVVTGVMSELQTCARIACRLLTRHTWTGEIISLALAVRNEGRGPALNVKVSLAPAPEYTLLDETEQMERLAAGEERQIELRVRPRLTEGITQFRARFVILYDDPRGPDQVENFADVVYLLADEGEFQFIPNPYVVGTPLQTGSSLFFGREGVIAFIQENLVAAHQNNLVLIGQRRTGKTSLLKQLPLRLGDAYVPVYLDGQSLALDPGLSNFFYSLATEIAFALEDRGLVLSGDLPDLSDFADSPATAFERKFLPKVREAIGDRHLLLLLDEFEELETAVRRGNIDSSIFGFLRHLIQHTDNLSVIFCGTHRLEELAADYWSVLFNISLYRHVAFLSQSDAMRLIQEPVASYNMRYDDLALDKMWRVTAGHPYFLQLLCHSLVNQHNKTERNYITVADVNTALDDILASGEAHFVYLWTESTREERLALTALSRMMPLTGQVTSVQVTDYLAERGINLERQVISQALHHLVLRDALRVRSSAIDGASADGVESYRWQLGLLGLWVEKYKSLSRVVDEVRT